MIFHTNELSKNSFSRFYQIFIDVPRQSAHIKDVLVFSRWEQKLYHLDSYVSGVKFLSAVMYRDILPTLTVLLCPSWPAVGLPRPEHLTYQQIGRRVSRIQICLFLLCWASCSHRPLAPAIGCNEAMQAYLVLFSRNIELCFKKFLDTLKTFSNFLGSRWTILHHGPLMNPLSSLSRENCTAQIPESIWSRFNDP